MKKAAICFTESGRELIRRLNRTAREAGIRPAEAYILKKMPYMDHGAEAGRNPEGASGGEKDGADPEFTRVTGSLAMWAADRFAEGAALIFVGAAGIAVRAVAGAVKDKLTDSPVIVIDDGGSFVIPILSGHAGGADKLACVLASLIGAVPVITASTDGHGTFSADVFAREQNLRIRNRDGIKRVSAKAIEGKPVTLSIKNYPPVEPVDIIVADETDREYSLLLSPKPYALGIGMKRGVAPGAAETFLGDFLSVNGASMEEIYAVCTIDLKEEEPAIRAFCDRHRLPLLAFDAALLRKAEGRFTSSEFVQKTVGVDNVCERAAVLGAGSGAQLVVRKHAGDGITAALARRKCCIG